MAIEVRCIEHLSVEQRQSNSLVHKSIYASVQKSKDARWLPLVFYVLP